MPRDKANVISALKKKGFQEGKRTHHQYLVFHTAEGKKSAVYTYVSHSGKELHDQLISAMAKQCKLTKSEFLNLVDCPMSRQEYEQSLKERSLL